VDRKRKRKGEEEREREREKQCERFKRGWSTPPPAALPSVKVEELKIEALVSPLAAQP